MNLFLTNTFLKDSHKKIISDRNFRKFRKLTREVNITTNLRKSDQGALASLWFSRTLRRVRRNFLSVMLCSVSGLVGAFAGSVGKGILHRGLPAEGFKTCSALLLRRFQAAWISWIRRNSWRGKYSRKVSDETSLTSRRLRAGAMNLLASISQTENWYMTRSWSASAAPVNRERHWGTNLKEWRA